MKEVFIFICCFLVFWGVFVVLSDKTIECDKIPSGERYKYARLINTNKCVMMSKSEIYQSRIDELEEEKTDLKYKNKELETERDWAFMELEENSPD